MGNLKQKIKQVNIADWLSISRVFFSLVLILFILGEHRAYFQWTLLIALTTDALDGFLARRLRITSIHGAKLDSFADAFLFCVCLAAIIVFETAFISAHSGLIIMALSIYLIQLACAFYKYGKPSSFHTYLAKIAALVQGLFFLVLFFWGVVEWLFYLTIAISLLETIEEILLIFILPKWRANIKGLFWILKIK